jgi:putative transposase
MNCKYCNSTNTICFGIYTATNGDIQRYWCKDCQRKFTEIDSLPDMKTSKKEIADAMGMYYGGMPLDSIQRQLQQQYGHYLSEAGIYKWIIRFTKEAVDQSRYFKPKVGDKWIADETVLNVGGNKIWFFDIIDSDTRFLLATHIANKRTVEDVQKLMEKAVVKAGKMPKVVITDKLNSYIEGVPLSLGGSIHHVRTSPFDADNNTNLIERFHGIMKDRMKVIRGFSNLETTRLLTDGWLVHYNFFKEHEALGNIPPAQAMKVKTPFKDWNDVLNNTGKPAPKPQTVSIPFFHRQTDLTPLQTKRKYEREKKRAYRAKKRAGVFPSVSMIRRVK